MEFLKQTKLIKSEWDSLEVPFTERETRILNLIQNGYNNPDIVHNYTTNMILFTKLPVSKEMQYFIYTKYFQCTIETIKTKYKISIETGDRSIKRLKSGDAIRVQNIDQMIQSNTHNIYEFVCIEQCKYILKYMAKKQNYSIYLYTLIQWRNAHIINNNPHVMSFVDKVIENGIRESSIYEFIKDSPNIIERNKDLYKYDNLSLFSHQKEIFTYCELYKEIPKLILYSAPTGTGKTLTPLGLSEGYKIIFVCVARHIGLSLAKSAINIDKKVAFAFGCETASDIRLHYFAAIDYEKNKRSGGIGKVDNSNGEAVEIMICDVQSYLVAMYYMLSFNDAKNIIMYWDEPTITLDYHTHELHPYIHENWKQNKIPNVILSCATIPKENAIFETLHDFKCHFSGALVHTITSYDCKKSIPIIKNDGYCYSPHTQFDNFDALQRCADYCTENRTLLRYFDLGEIVDFILKVHDGLDVSSNIHMNNYFDSICDITMNSLKIYYLDVLLRIDESHWNRVSSQCKRLQLPKYNTETSHRRNESELCRMQSMPNELNMSSSLFRVFSESGVNSKKSTINSALNGVLLTTTDAITLTDGPTIYLADNLLNLAKFYTKQSNIPEFILKKLIQNIESNELLKEKIKEMENTLAVKIQTKDNSDTSNINDNIKTKTKTKTNKQTNEKSMDENTLILKQNIDELKKQIIFLSLQPEYIPNREEHQHKLRPHIKHNKQAFTSNIDEKTVKEVMGLKIHRDYKLLVLMGIGVLIENHNKAYEEIVKRLAQEQQLYLILASSDFIYGTNYQFCHGFIGKDLPNMTQQKILQSMGRIGRNSTQQDYSIRFRVDSMIDKLFYEPEENIEAINMNNLLNHD